MQRSVVETAEHAEVLPGHVLHVLAELGVKVESGLFDVEPDEFELIEASLLDYMGSKTVPMAPGRTARDMAQAFGLKDADVQKTLITKLRVMATQTTVLQDDVAEKLAEVLGFEVLWAEPTVRAKPKPAAGSEAPLRPPVVTILGHVDHGKTSLLDYIRKANVVAKEHGGITQHIGAYQVDLPEGLITFLDTPGHAAFTAMRARGAQVTDIAILVVAADDGIMPQTIEAISHVKSAGVPIIVAVNKIDKPAANPDRVLQQLTEHELVPEAYGGDVITANVSAITGEGVPELLELILLQAEVLELRADPKAEFAGVIIEAKMERGRGPVGTLLVQEGTLRIGDVLIVGETWGKIKAMTDHRGERLKEAPPSTPVEILGINDVPMAGDKVARSKDEREGRVIAEERASKARAASLAAPKRKVTLRDLRRQQAAEDVLNLNLIVKADVQGSVEAVRGLLEKLNVPGVAPKILHQGVGAITESDVLLASASDAIIVGFNTKAEGKAASEASRARVEVRTYNIIYELIEDIEKAVKGKLEPKYEEVYQATIEVRAVFNLSRAGKVAGCHVTDGRISRNDKVRVKRGTEIVFDGELLSLRNVKQDVREMAAGQDCGLKFQGWEDFAVGDLIEAYELVQVND